MTDHLKTLRDTAEKAPDTFPLGSKGEVEAGVFYDAVRPKIIALLDLVAELEGALCNAKNGLAMVEHKFERAGGVWEVARKGVELGAMSWASNVENGLHNAKIGMDEALSRVQSFRNSETDKQEGGV